MGEVGVGGGGKERGCSLLLGRGMGEEKVMI